MNDRIIVVLGATGAQGGGLVRALLDHPEAGFVPRAVTRNADSDRALALAELGADVVAADLERPESIARTFEGAYGAFCVTFFWEHFSPEIELRHAGILADAAAESGLRHVVWSTLEDTRKWIPLEDDRMPTLHERYKVPHFDGKGEANQLFLDARVPTTLLLTSFYWDNFIHFGMGPKRGPDGTLAITLPMGDAKLPGIAAEDIGKCAFGIFAEEAHYIGRTVGIAGGHPTGAEMAQALGEALGETVRYEAVPPEVYRELGFPGADDLGNMFQFKRDFNDYYCGVRNLEESRRLNPGLQDFRTWAHRNAERIPIT